LDKYHTLFSFKYIYFFLQITKQAFSLLVLNTKGFAPIGSGDYSYF